MDNILIIKTSALGDIVHVYPVVSYLKAKFPKASIDWVVEASGFDLVGAHPDIRRVIPVATKQWRKAPFKGETWKGMVRFFRDLRSFNYDVAFDFQGNTKSGVILAGVKSPLKVGFGWASVPERPNLLFTNRRFNPPLGLNIREDYLTLAMKTFGEEELSTFKFQQVQLVVTDEQRLGLQSIVERGGDSSQIVLVCPGSAWKNKQMTPEALGALLRKFVQVANTRFLFAWGNSGEKLIAEDLARQFPTSRILPKLSLPLLQNLMGLCDLVVAMDSLPLHLAGTTKTPTFSVFGASSAQKYKPIGNQHIAYQGECPYGRSFNKRCPVLRTCPTGACIRDLDGAEVFKSISPEGPS